jgi:predicted ferric reductase
MNATIALFGFGFVARLLMMLVSNIFFHHRAEISLQCGLVRVTIPTNMKWSPGMHIFIRFAHIRPFQSHPFTISSIPSAEADGRNEMIFLIRPETGFTHVLAEVAAKSSPDRKFWMARTEKQESTS